MAEMQHVIKARKAAQGWKSRGFVVAEHALGRSQSQDSVAGPSRLYEPPSAEFKRLTEMIQGHATAAEDNISNAASSHSQLENDLRTLISAYEEV